MGDGPAGATEAMNRVWREKNIYICEDTSFF